MTRLIDFGEPAAVLCVAVLHLVPDAAGPEAIIAPFRDRICAGSYLVLSQFAVGSDPAAVAGLRAAAADTRWRFPSGPGARSAGPSAASSSWSPARPMSRTSGRRARCPPG